MIDRRRPIQFAITIALLALVGGGNASAADGGNLPGVNGDYRIVKPAPAAEPDDDTSSSDGKNAMRIGDWDVTISGSITVDVGVGNLPGPRDHGGPRDSRPR